jgi:WD40 repeat protein
MITPHRIHLLVISCLLAGLLIGSVSAVSLGIDWKERPASESPFSGVAISSDGSIVYAGGNQMLVRSWDGNERWGGRSGKIAAMSADGNHVVQAIAKTVVLLDKDGVESWSRTMGGNIQAVAIASDGSFVISTDDLGHLNSWGPNGEFLGRNENFTARNVAIAPTNDLVVITTERGLVFYNPVLNLVWLDNRTSGFDFLSADSSILITADGSTIITAGANQVASYTKTGALNWRKEVTTNPIIDIAMSSDGSAIIVGSQDKKVVALDRYGVIHWTFSDDQWINAVGVSRDASVIAVGGNDRNLYILDHSGKVITSRQTDAIIQPRSIAVSRDGKRIVVSDQNLLYGFSLIGDLVVTEAPIVTQPELTTLPTTIATQTVTSRLTTPPVTTAIPPATTTPRSPVSMVPVVLAVAILGLFLRK